MKLYKTVIIIVPLETKTSLCLTYTTIRCHFSTNIVN